MPKSRQKGVITLTSARSGSSWLGGLVRSAGTMGHPGEWLDVNTLPKPPKSYNADSFFAQVIAKASSANGHFAMKVFPKHLQNTTGIYHADFLRHAYAEHDVKFILLTREDRLGQAISLVRAQQTGKWGVKAATPETAKPQRYSFKSICKAYFRIGERSAFWRSYLAINTLPFFEFSYESLLPDPTPFVAIHAEHFDEPMPSALQPHLTIQRDALTAEWRQRFEKDIATRGVHHGIFELESPKPSLANGLRVALGHPLKP